MRTMLMFLLAALACASFSACDQDDPGEEPGSGPLFVEAPDTLRTCASEADCILVSSTCIGCCDRTAVNRADSTEFAAYRMHGCRNSPSITCGCCQQAAKAACVDGLCTMVVMSEDCR